MVRVEVKIRPHDRGKLPNWLHSNSVREARGTYFAIMDIDIPKSSKIDNIPEYIKQQLRERLKTIEGIGDIQFRPILENNNNNNNLGNVMAAMGSITIGNLGKSGKTRKSKAKVIGFEKLFDEVAVAAPEPPVKEKTGSRHSTSRNRTRRAPTAASAAMNRSRSRSRNRETRRGRSRTARANRSMAVNSIREMAAAAASARLRNALANAPEARSRSRAKSKTPMMSKPAEERVAIIQSYVKKWYKSLLEKAKPSRTERSRSRLRINGVTITPEQERKWRNEEEQAQHKIEDAIYRRAEKFYQSELEKYGLPESHNMGFLHG